MVGVYAAPAASLAFTLATVTAVRTTAPAGGWQPSAVSLAASARSDREPSGLSSRVMIGASERPRRVAGNGALWGQERPPQPYPKLRSGWLSPEDYGDRRNTTRKLIASSLN